MNVLKAFASGALRVFKFLLPVAASVAGSQFGINSNTITAIVTVIGSIERSFEAMHNNDKTGPAKYLAALPLVKDIIMQSEIVSGRNILNADQFTAGCGDIINGFVKILNSLEHQA